MPIIRTNKLREGNKIEEIDGKIILTKAVNLDSILAHNYELRKDDQDGWAKDRSYRHFGSVPMETLLNWKKEFPEILSGDREAEHRALKILFNRPENEVFMTVQKKAGSTL